MQRLILSIVIALMALTLSLSALAATVPTMMNYQGRLANAVGAFINDTCTIQFSIFADSTGGIPLWTETHSAARVRLGIFSVLLGEAVPLTDTVFKSDRRWLEIKARDDAPMSPRTPFVSVAYAFRATYADSAKFIPQSDTVWKVSNGNAYRLTGNVGIGTDQPDSKVDIRGVTQVVDIGSTPDTRPYATFGVTRPATNDNLSYIGLTRQGAIPWGIGISPSSMLIFGQASSPTQTIPSPRMAIDPFSGNVGVGTTSPGYKLDVSGDMRATGTLYGNNLYCTNLDATNWIYGVTTFIGNAPSNGQGHEFLRNGEAHIGIGGNVGIGTMSPGYKLDVIGNSRTTGTHFAGGLNMSGEIVMNQNGIQLGPDSWLKYNYESLDTYVNGPLGQSVVLRCGEARRKVAFSHDGTTGHIFSYGTMSLESETGIIYANPISASSSMNGVNAVTGTSSGNYSGVAGLTNGTGNGIYGWSSGTGYAGSFSGNVCYTGTLGKCSDSRFKTNVAPLTGSLARVSQLRGVSYDWRRDEFPQRNFPANRQIGFIAQELQQVVPEVVNKGADGYYTVDYAQLTALLTEAVKELKAQNDELRNRVEVLERRAGLDGDAQQARR
jgi:hypothetical protein